MIRSIINLLIIFVIGSNNEPKYDLHKKQEPVFKGLNWTFIVLAIIMVLFFVSIFVFQIGNEYPNNLMENL